MCDPRLSPFQLRIPSPYLFHLSVSINMCLRALQIHAETEAKSSLTDYALNLVMRAEMMTVEVALASSDV